MLALFFLVGFISQMIDGSLGMAYGVCCNSIIQSAFGINALASSTMVHFSEIATSAVSAISHYRLKNFDKKKFWKLVIPGVIGGIIGATLLSQIGSYLSTGVSIYLLATGLLLLVNAIIGKSLIPNFKALPYPVAFIGGLLDATGGGGWGPVVTSTLLCTDRDTSKTIGSINAAEFFVTIAETAIFSLNFQLISIYWKEMLCLMFGGICAAPLAALLCKKVNQRLLMAIVGVLVIAINIYKILS